MPRRREPQLVNQPTHPDTWDQYPGRCKNMLAHYYIDVKLMTYLRCLEAVGTQHTCRFPDPPMVIDCGNGIYALDEWTGVYPPRPWVVPE